MLLVVHAALTFLISVLGYHYGNLLDKLLDLIKDTVAPIVAVLIPTILIMVMNKNKKSATTVISTLVVARIPLILASIVSVVRSILPKIGLISSPIVSTLSAITMVLTYFGMRTLFEEEKQSFLPKFAIIECITYLVLYLF